MVRKGARRGATPELKSQSSPSSVAPKRLVLCLLNGWCFAARVFRSRRGASDEHIPKWICKERATKPGAKRTAALWVAPSLACGFVARRSQPHCGGCSLLAPRHRPNWAQQNTSHLGDTTLVIDHVDFDRLDFDALPFEPFNGGLYCGAFTFPPQAK